MPPFDDSILRMIDANLNRCREGLRVLEDCARFALDDPALSKRVKSARHTLREAVASLPIRPESIIAARDTAGDVGTTISTDAEQSRTDTRDLVHAAAKRTTEALRVIEESTKALGAHAAAFESIRYATYDIERDLIAKLRPRCPQWALCVLITRDLCTHHPPEEVVKRAAQGGADCIQIREKHMPDAMLLTHATRLTQIAHAAGMHVMINDRPHIARLVGADGVHLGQDDLPTHAARSLLGPTYWIGRTCPTIEHAFDAIAEGADTCGLGPVFPSTTKSKPQLAGTQIIESYLQDPRTRPTPMLAISGINEHNITQLAHVRCPGVAVSSAVCSSHAPERVCQTIVQSLRGNA